MSKKPAIGIFGGTFNPPHTGHVQVVKTAVARLGLNQLVIVPSGIPPHKQLPDNTPSAEIRLNMARMAFGEMENVTVSDIEVKKDGLNYTIDTVRELIRLYGDAEFYLLTGTDMFLSLETWRESAALLKLVKPVVFPRNPGDIAAIAEYSHYLESRYGVATISVTGEIVDISSSGLRVLLPERKGAGYINDTIYAYIIKHRLYGARPDWDWLRNRAYFMLAPERIPHVRGCEDAAVGLAERWGADPDDAREAAILHDITKKLTLNENLSVLSRYGIPSDETQFIVKSEEKLLHSKTGAILAKEEFGVSGPVADAIMWHTTGRANMGLLEKIIYLADYIESTRDFEGVSELRELAFSNLDKAVILGLEMSVADMQARGITPNRTTFDALGFLKKEWVY